jgi:thioredoxin 1
MSSVLSVSDATFDTEVLANDLPVLVDFWAPWCGPCRVVGPVVEAIAQDYAGRVKVVKLNTDENPVTASRYEIRSIPTLMLFQAGKLVDTAKGAVPQATLRKMLDTHRATA